MAGKDGEEIHSVINEVFHKGRGPGSGSGGNVYAHLRNCG